MKEPTVTPSPRIEVALADVRSAHNVGSIFRTADGAGVSHVHLIGTTPTPIDRFGRARADIAKVALGAERSVPWTYHEDGTAFLTAMHAAGRVLVAVEQDSRAEDYRSLSLPDGAVFVFGNEVTGVSRELLDAAERVIHVPMHGQKESLNVSVTVGVVLFSLLHHN